MTASSIREVAAERGITRLCHFTPSRNLAHIVSDPRGILASRYLRDEERVLFNPTDEIRLDGFPDHVCCSVEYPNSWYLRTARKREVLFRDWVVLVISPSYLWKPGTKFCPRNAAATGARVQEGVEAFQALFDDTVSHGGISYRRRPKHPDFLPTDEQAEVLIPGRIDRSDVIAVAVRDDEQARGRSG